eukprot:211446_1
MSEINPLTTPLVNRSRIANNISNGNNGEGDAYTSCSRIFKHQIIGNSELHGLHTLHVIQNRNIQKPKTVRTDPILIQIRTSNINGMLLLSCEKRLKYSRMMIYFAERKQSDVCCQTLYL